MRTQLGTYCQQFDGILRPLLQHFDAALAAIDAAAPAAPGRGLRAPLTDVRHHVLALCDKVAEQQAYVLIFGPLKSGKSTLMNAIAGAYVSEVSSLPAYPCLVFVSAGARREFVVTDYDGAARTFTDAKELHAHIDRAHGDLAQAIRAAEQQNVAFDPQEHFPRAIRRVDVRVPDSELATTGAVLVDTPGLYTRMRFGYDRMTRDFRNAAACAIFVVKSDTLFLEQVFAEFQQLLDLFSRIFLVVNVDSHKRDVSPDGRLVPSLEQSEPGAVLRAFEQLAMSAPLQKAAAEGRVRMYPADLMHAASAALSKQDAADTERRGPGFAAFRRELAEYLASSEYLAAFLHDSLHRADGLLAEAHAAGTGDEVGALAAKLGQLDEQIGFLQAEQRRVQQVLQLDWTETFARGRRELEAELDRVGRDAGAKLLRTLGASIDTWFLSSHSLDWLVTGQWTPLVLDYRDEVAATGRRVFEQQVQQQDAGLDLPDGVPDLARRAGIDPRALRQQTLAALPAVAWSGPATVPVDCDRIPLKRGMLDMMVFRSLDKVRRRLFGSQAKPDTKIPGKDKAKYLGEPGRLHLHQCVALFRGDLAPATVAALKQRFGADLAAATAAALRQRFADHLPRLRQREAELAAERDRLQALAQPLQRLAAAAAALRTPLRELGRRFDHQDLPQPAAGADVVLEPAPRRGRDAKPPHKHRDERPPQVSTPKQRG
jgi:energy-coupling factor transporter ATP-binding protein EcfA2